MRSRFALPLALALGACTASHSEPAAQQPAPYLATAVGRIDSAGEARHLVAAADGVIERVLVRRGDRVKAGQVLVEVGCAPRAGLAAAAMAAAQQSQAEAALVRAGPRREAISAGSAVLAKAEADLRGAEQQLERVKALAGRGFVSRRELDARSAERDAAVATRNGAAAELAALSSGSRPQELASAHAAAGAAGGQSAAAHAALAQCHTDLR